jgi:Zn-dependent M32 family carboxypeptidase
MKFQITYRNVLGYNKQMVVEAPDEDEAYHRFLDTYEAEMGTRPWVVSVVAMG